MIGQMIDFKLSHNEFGSKLNPNKRCQSMLNICSFILYRSHHSTSHTYRKIYFIRDRVIWCSVRTSIILYFEMNHQVVACAKWRQIIYNVYRQWINKRTECEPSLLVAAEGSCGSQCRDNAIQHSEHVGQHDGTPHDGALSAQRNR